MDTKGTGKCPYCRRKDCMNSEFFGIKWTVRNLLGRVRKESFDCCGNWSMCIQGLGLGTVTACQKKEFLECPDAVTI